MGNLLAIVAARDAALGASAREGGIAGAPLTAYAAAGVHDSVGKAMTVAGIGRAALRAVAVDARYAIDVADLRERIAAIARPAIVRFWSSRPPAASTWARSTISTRSRTCAPRSGCGCTSTARSARSSC